MGKEIQVSPEMKEIYFDLGSIPIYILVICTFFSRKMNRYREYHMFYIMNTVSLVCAIVDVVMEYVVNPPPLVQTAVTVGWMLSFLYKMLRNSSLIVYFLFILSITRTEYNIASLRRRILLWTPQAVVVVLLLQNFFTGNVFRVTAEHGYERGPLLMAVYGIAMIYWAFGLVYTIWCRKYLTASKWLALILVFALTMGSVVVQMFMPHLMVEMFATAIALLVVMFLVIRPEETIDANVDAENLSAFQPDLRNLLLSKHRFSLMVFHIPNASERRSHLGDASYAAYISEIIDAVHIWFREKKLDTQIYYEQPENLYLIVTDEVPDPTDTVQTCIAHVNDQLTLNSDRGIGFNPLVCVICCPDDLSEYDSVMHLCHRFQEIEKGGRRIRMASEFVGTKEFAVIDHIETIIRNAINGGGLEVFYQPIYDVTEKRFRSAEALARIRDAEFGLISPAIFIPAAEKSGMILPMGTAIIESVFRFISRNPLEELGLSYIEINLSVLQCLQRELPDIIGQMQKKYGVSPAQINFEVTESIMASADEVMDHNLRRLSEMGYSFSLDDYGTGYSNLRRLRRLPLNLVKIDKSMVDDMFTTDGSIIMKNTIQMMQGIRKQLVIEGVETQETLTALEQMSCDYIQGFYFSKPLPEKEFADFLIKNNLESADKAL